MSSDIRCGVGHQIDESTGDVFGLTQAFHRRCVVEVVINLGPEFGKIQIQIGFDISAIKVRPSRSHGQKPDLPRTYAVDSDPRPRNLMAKLHGERFDEPFGSTICRQHVTGAIMSGSRRRNHHDASSATLTTGHWL